LFQGYAPLSTFSARIQIAFALGILPKSLRDKIEITRRMRNDFAHEWGPIDFNEPRFANRLRFIVKHTEPVKEQEKETEEALKQFGVLGPTKDQLVTRIAFALAVNRILIAIEDIINVAIQGYDVRPLVRHMEAEKLWEGPE
jgi:DNA-binding MltR family transcriptional regulator